MIGVASQLLLTLLLRLLSSLWGQLDALQAFVPSFDSALRARTLLELLVPGIVMRVLALVIPTSADPNYQKKGDRRMNI